MTVQLTDEEKSQVESVKKNARELLALLIEAGVVEMGSEFMAVLRRLAENPVKDQP